MTNTHPQLPLFASIRKPHGDPTTRIVPTSHHPPMQPLDDLFGRLPSFHSVIRTLRTHETSLKDTNPHTSRTQ